MLWRQNMKLDDFMPIEVHAYKRREDILLVKSQVGIYKGETS